MAGSWNSAIFSPEWLSRSKITEQREVGIGIDLSTRAVEFLFDDVSLWVYRERLKLQPVKPGDEVLERAETIAVKILKLLPHTPILEVGVNFVFEETEHVDRYAHLHEGDDLTLLGELGMKHQATILQRRLITSEGDTLNFKTVLDRGTEGDEMKMRFDFNFNRRSDERADWPSRFLNKRTVGLKDQASKVIEEFRKSAQKTLPNPV